MGDCACHATGLLSSWGGEGTAFVFLELTPSCNNRCVGCSNVFADRRVSAPLSGDGWIEILTRIAPDTKWVKLTGGEPTLHPDFDQIVSWLNRRHLPFRLLTNGRWPDPAQTLEMLVESRSLESLLISLHGPDAESHEAFTGVEGSFAEAVSTISQAAAAGLTTATSTVITRHNWDRGWEMIEFALGLGADHVAFNRYIGPPLPNLEPRSDQIVEALTEIESYIAQGASVRFGTPIPQCIIPNSTTRCLAGQAFVTVDPWGQVRPCNHASQMVGSIIHNDLSEILDRPPIAEWRALFPPECESCDQLNICGAGCRAEMAIRDVGLFPAPMLDSRVDHTVVEHVASVGR